MIPMPQCQPHQLGVGQSRAARLVAASHWVLPGATGLPETLMSLEEHNSSSDMEFPANIPDA